MISHKKMYLLGSGITHSASPSYWANAFAQKGISWTYELADISSEIEAKMFIESKSYVAINITTPWKSLAYECADERSEIADFAYGCNLILNFNNKLLGYNVDGIGCIDFLESKQLAFQGLNVVVCGFGPTAKSIAYVAKCNGAHVTILSRNSSKERCLLCKSHGIGLLDYREAKQKLATANLVINATTLGMRELDSSPIPIKSMHSDCIYFDCVYGHGETAYLKNAKSLGARAFDGTGMLEFQAKACEKIVFA